jgi:hypothetical protein
VLKNERLADDAEVDLAAVANFDSQADLNFP